jgi:hypothetical protein
VIRIPVSAFTDTQHTVSPVLSDRSEQLGTVQLVVPELDLSLSDSRHTACLFTVQFTIQYNLFSNSNNTTHNTHSHHHASASVWSIQLRIHPVKDCLITYWCIGYQCPASLPSRHQYCSRCGQSARMCTHTYLVRASYLSRT